MPASRSIPAPLARAAEMLRRRGHAVEISPEPRTDRFRLFVDGRELNDLELDRALDAAAGTGHPDEAAEIDPP